MLNQLNFTLINQQNGNPAFKLFSFEGNDFFDHLQRNNFFTLIWVTEGARTVNADFDGHDFETNSLFTFAPYQPFVENDEGNANTKRLEVGEAWRYM